MMTALDEQFEQAQARIAELEAELDNRDLQQQT